MTATTISYTVSVDTTVSPAKYTIYDSEKNPTEAPTSVTVANTVITYTLEENSNMLRFIAPEIHQFFEFWWNPTRGVHTERASHNAVLRYA